jgi:hypothetical protein
MSSALGLVGGNKNRQQHSVCLLININIILLTTPLSCTHSTQHVSSFFQARRYLLRPGQGMRLFSADVNANSSRQVVVVTGGGTGLGKGQQADMYKQSFSTDFQLFLPGLP